MKYPNSIGPTLRFIAPLLSNQPSSGPIIRAVLKCLNAIFGTWPEHLEVMPYLTDLARLSSWIQLVFNYAEDAESRDLCAQVQSRINKICDAARLLREASNFKTLDIAPNLKM